MVSENLISNMHYVNAPAGSGKTFFINQKISDLIEEKPDVRILCITYTDRAASVLKSRIQSNDVFISTIHSFINYFMNPFYKHQEAIDLYFELYKDEILLQLEKNESKDSEDSENKNSTYLKHKELDISETLTIDIIKSNTHSIYYNEKNYNSLYYGGLSHDNLLYFAFAFLNRYPILRFRLKEMFEYIFIDEVQDTDTNILNLFFESANGTSTKVFYFGDKMQEIYDNYDGTFEEKYSSMDKSTSQRFKTNYRSNQQIVGVLNNLYKSSLYISQTSKKGLGKFTPVLYICEDIDEVATTLSKDTLVLKISNRSRFRRDDPNETMENLFNAINTIYPQGSKVKVIDALLPQNDERSPDQLINFFYTLDYILLCFDNLQYADIIQIFNNENFISNNGSKQHLFTSKTHIIEHIHKKRVSLLLKKASEIYAQNNKTLGEILKELVDLQLINSLFVEDIALSTNDEGIAVYSKTLNIRLLEFKNLVEFRKKQIISTQHGVKGEGHTSVCFYAEDSTRNRPYVSMYKFFELFSTIHNFNLDEFQQLFYEYKSKISEFESVQKIKISKIMAKDIDETFAKEIDDIILKYTGNRYFETIYKIDLKKYRDKRNSNKLPTKESVQNICKPDTINRILVAYKLFYVGCSRAMDELIILIDERKISPYEDKFITKMKDVGFLIEKR